MDGVDGRRDKKIRQLVDKERYRQINRWLIHTLIDEGEQQ